MTKKTFNILLLFAISIISSMQVMAQEIDEPDYQKIRQAISTAVVPTIIQP